MRSVILAALLGAAFAAQAQLYRWTDAQGRVHVTDTPPPPSAKNVRSRSTDVAPASGAGEPYALQLAVKNHPVKLYTAPDCAPCGTARTLLNARGVPFSEVSVIDERQAEELKKKSASALSDRVGEDERLSLPSALVRSSGGPSRKTLCRIVELRLTELFHLVRRDLEGAELFQSIGSGIVLTGGGALLGDIALLAERETELPVRLGLPRGFCGLREVIDSPVYATAAGLVKYGLKCGQARSTRPPGRGRVFGEVRRWLDRYF